MAQFIGIEGGGTKFVCAYGSGPDDLKDITIIHTRTPQETMPEVFAYIRNIRKKTEIQGIGLAIFGFLDLHPSSPTFGHILPTAKPHWGWYDILGELKKVVDLPIGLDTDVNGAVIGEHKWGAGKDLGNVLYLTIGTGIGGGAIVNNKILHGAMHPEMGHIMLYQDKLRDPFPGVCSYHHNCLEGLASGPAMKKRWGVESALELPAEHEAWDIEAEYLGRALAAYTMVLSPQRIILGGGVMKRHELYPKVRRQMLEVLQGYINIDLVLKYTDTYVVPPALGDNSGILGAIALAEEAWLVAEIRQ